MILLPASDSRSAPSPGATTTSGILSQRKTKKKEHIQLSQHFPPNTRAHIHTSNPPGEPASKLPRRRRTASAVCGRTCAQAACQLSFHASILSHTLANSRQISARKTVVIVEMLAACLLSLLEIHLPLWSSALYIIGIIIARACLCVFSKQSSSKA